MNQRDESKADDELMRLAANLDKEVQPERDLWPAVDAAISRPRRRFGWRFYAGQAAAVLLLVGSSSTLTWLAVKDDRATVTPSVATNAVPLDAAMANFGPQYSLGPGFQDARRDLEGRLERELQRLSPEARAGVEANMRAIRAAIADINEALAQEPDNVLLQELLLNAYREELAVMRKVNGITNSVMLRNDL